MVIENLLPEVVRYELIVSGRSCAQGNLEKGESVAAYQVEYQQTVELLVTISGFTCMHALPITSEPTAHGRIKLARDKDRPLVIDVETIVGENGCRNVTLFSKYWIVNATGLQLFFFAIFGVRKTPITAQRPPSADQPRSIGGSGGVPWLSKEHAGAASPIMYAPEDAVMDSGDAPQIAFRTSGSKLSKAFDIDSVGVPRELTIFEEKHVSQEYRHMFLFGVAIELAQGKFFRTKVVTVRPRIFLANHCLREVYYKQKVLGANFVYTLPPGGVLPFHWPHKDGVLQLAVSLAPTADFGCWSGGFSISDIGRFCLRVPSAIGAAADLSEFLWTEVTMSSATLVVSFSPCPKDRPAYRIENRTQQPAVICQVEIGSPITVPPGASVPYAWDEPTRPKRKLLVTMLGQSAAVQFPKNVNLDKIGSRYSVSIAPPASIGACVRLDGRVKVLVLEPVSDDSPAPSTTPLPIQEVAATLQSNNRLSLSMALHGIGVSLVSSAPRELLYASLDGIQMRYCSNESSETLEVSAESVQIDNQLHITRYPVLLCAADRVRGSRMLSATVIRSKRYRGEVQYFPYLGVLVNEFNLSVDEALLNSLIDFSGLMAPTATTATTAIAPTASEQPVALATPTDARNVYFELLHINPLKCNFSFGASIEDQGPAMTNPLRELLGGMSLLSVEMAPITLSALLMRNPFFAENQFAQTIGEYYKSQVLRQLYSVVLRLDCIGAPLMLFNFCGQGLIDFFYEPAAGFVKSPDEFARGLSKGAQSLIRNTVLGIFNSGKKLLGTLGMGAASLSMDSDYQRGHLLSSAKDPKHVGEGLLFGAKDFGKGVVRGFTGVVTEPIKGAQREGVAGFMKGIGIGMVGVAVKPTVGMLDMATQTAKGIINTATYFEAKTRRARPPRHFGQDGVLRDYDEQSAAGQTILCTIAKGKFRGDVYAFHADLPAPSQSSGKTVLVSHTNVFLLHSEAHDRFAIDFLLSVKDIAKVEKLDGELRMHTRQPSGPQQPTQQLWRSIFTGTSAQGIELLNKLTAIVTALWAQQD
jgi:vacuolar protein sorting-associated protein 13A/C